MLGKKDLEEKLFFSFSLTKHVPEDNFYRRLKKVLDLHFLYDMVKPYYGTEGQKSIDPTVFFRLLLAGYLENIHSDRKLIEHASMRLDILYFVDHNIDESLPWHSTISRTRNMLPQAIFEEAFNRVLTLCVDSGLVAGHTQAIDSAYVKANASLDSVERKQPKEDLAEYMEKTRNENDEPQRKANNDKSTPEQRTIQANKNQLRDTETHQKWFKGRETGPLGSQNKQARYLSNKTHYSPVDPDARIAVKPGKPRLLYYLSNISVDTAHHVITHIQSNHADRKDSRYLIDMVRRTKLRLKQNNILIDQVMADAGYSSGENYRFLENLNITGWIPPHAQYESTRKGFVYEKEHDRWKCRNGKYVTFRKIKYQKEHPEKMYYTKRSDCKGYPFAVECKRKSHEKRITITLYRDEYDRALERARSKQGRYYKTLRQSTVEPVFGTLINFTGLRKINTYGIENAGKGMLMVTMAYNLKKLMKYTQNKSTDMANRVLFALKTMIKPLIKLYFEQIKQFLGYKASYINVK